MLRQIRLLVFDLDYLIFDSSDLRIRALRQSLVSFADNIPQSVRLPDFVDAEEGYRDHGFRWTQFLEIGLDEERLSELQHAYRIHEERLIGAGAGRLFPGMEEFLMGCRQRGLELALGADASRDYLLAVSDRHRLDIHFQMEFCTEEFGVGSSDEMLEEIMLHHQVNSSETLVFGTRPALFEAAHNLDLLAVGCGWGIRGHQFLAQADFQILKLEGLSSAIEAADSLSARDFA